LFLFLKWRLSHGSSDKAGTRPAGEAPIAASRANQISAWRKRNDMTLACLPACDVARGRRGCRIANVRFLSQRYHTSVAVRRICFPDVSAILGDFVFAQAAQASSISGKETWMRLSTILVGTRGFFGTGKNRKMKVKESRLWARAGLEPSTTELLADPIAILLMQADKLQAAEVERLLREARHRGPRARRAPAPALARGRTSMPGRFDA
jgi:hypothetical protein